MTKTVTVNRQATITQGALTGFTGTVVAYDYPENEVIIQLDDRFRTNITVTSEMIDQPDKFGNKQSEQLSAFPLTNQNDNMDIFIVEYREVGTGANDLVVHPASSENKAADWIKENGIDDDQPDGLKYYYAVFIMKLDDPGNGNDNNDDYLAYFDKHGKKINSLDEIN